MDVLLVVGLLTCVPFSKAIFMNRTDEFPEDEKSQIAKLLLDKNFPEFEAALRKLFGGPGGRNLRLTPSYEQAMHEILSTQDRSYVILESMLADHVLIPQCDCEDNRAFILEYKVLRTSRNTSVVQDKLQKAAQESVAKINRNKYDLFVTAFHHVKEIVKVGLAFSNRTLTCLEHEIRIPVTNLM